MEDPSREDDDEASFGVDVDVEHALVAGDDTTITITVKGNAGGHKAADSENWATLWMILVTTATLVGRRILTAGFPYPIIFVLLIQITAYLGVGLVVLSIKTKGIFLWSLERKCVSERQYTWFETFIIVLRLVLHIILSTAAMICGAESLQHYTNLPVLAILPMFTYVMDSLLFRIAGSLRLLQSDHHTTNEGLFRIFLAFFCVLLAVYDDYRLNVRGLLFGLASSSLVSLANLVPRIGPRIDNGSVHTWECPLYMYLLTEIPPMIITAFAAYNYEAVGSAFWIVWSWGGWGFLSSLAPGACLLVVFRCSMNTPCPLSVTSAPVVLEDNSSQGRTAVATTLQASFWIACIGVFLGEKNLIDWMQILAFVLFYVVGVGSRQIGFYPPRLMNLVARILRRPQQKIATEPWQLPVFLWTTVSIFVALVSSSIVYWGVNVTYARDLKNWTGPQTLSLDSGYVPPQPYLFDIVIAHSEGDPLQSISDLISTFSTLESLQPNYPQVKIYTKDQSLNTIDFSNFTGSFTGPLTAVVLQNTGGVAATFLHHLLYSWEFLPTQTLFLSTSSSMPLSSIKRRFNDYFIPALPIHSQRSAEPVTSFLNLGEYESCKCGSCADSQGWTDTFHLIPSMFGAAYPDSPPCKSALLTYGNDFVASADRIRGLKRDVWQMLYDALVNPNLRNAWAHDEKKVPGRKTGGEGKKWFFGDKDSLEKPYLGYTLERLWGTLLQCSSMEIAWRCPNTERGWRRGGTKADCGCLHW